MTSVPPSALAKPQSQRRYSSRHEVFHSMRWVSDLRGRGGGMGLGNGHEETEAEVTSEAKRQRSLHGFWEFEPHELPMRVRL